MTREATALLEIPSPIDSPRGRVATRARTLCTERAKPAERVEGRAAASRQSERPDRWEMFSQRHDRGTRLIQSG